MAGPVPGNEQVVGLNVPDPVLVKVTVPVGVVGLALMSVTTAVHDVAWLTATLPVAHETVVVVAGAPIVTVKAKTAEPKT